MTKIPLKPKNEQNIHRNPKNDQNIPNTLKLPKYPKTQKMTKILPNPKKWPKYPQNLT